MHGPMMVAPVVTAQPGLTAQVVVGQPNTASSPFTYAVSQTDLTANSTGPASVSGDPVVDGDTAVLTVDHLTNAHEYTFAVTITDSTGASTSSAASVPITATT